MVKTETVNVLGVDFLNLNNSNLINWFLNPDVNAIPIRFINVHSLANIFKNVKYAESINSNGINFADGFPIVFWSLLRMHKTLRRMRGYDFFLAVVTSKLVANRQIFIVPNSSVADQLPIQLTTLNSQINLGPIITPPVSEDIDFIIAYIQKCVEFNPDDIVWVALGSEKQDLISQKIALSVKASIGIGAAINFFSGEVKQCPRTLSNLGLEWLFRIFVEPRRLWRRYLFDFFILIKIVKQDFRR